MEKENFYQSVLLGKHTHKVVDNASIQDLSDGYHYDSHFHSTVEILICVSGSCTLTILQTPVELKTNEYLVIFPDNPHCTDVASPSGCRLLQIHFHPEIFMDMFSDRLKDNGLSFLLNLSLNQKKYLKSRTSGPFSYCVYYLIQEARQHSDNWEKMLDLYFSQLVILISRDVNDCIPSDNICSNRHIVMSVYYINQNYAQKMTVDDIAGYCGVSSRFLTKLFNEQFGLNISTYITYFRINKSIEIMNQHENNYPLTQLALDVGFGSLQHYSKIFKEKMSMTPTNYFFPGKKSRQ